MSRVLVSWDLFAAVYLVLAYAMMYRCGHEHIKPSALMQDDGRILILLVTQLCALASIAAFRAEADVRNLLAPVRLDTTAGTWPVTRANAIVCCNMIHIAPWAATIGLIRGGARVLGPGGLLYLYGPFRRQGRHTAPSNKHFDLDLRRRDPAWGVRDVKAVAAQAAAEGFTPPLVEEMPANNLSLIFWRQG